MFSIISFWRVATGWSVLLDVQREFTGRITNIKVTTFYLVKSFSLMRECWHWDDAKRPTFRQTHHDMENMFQVIIIN